MDVTAVVVSPGREPPAGLEDGSRHIVRGPERGATGKDPSDGQQESGALSPAATRN